MQLRPIIIGTAGHIDHGKTSLVRALTGVDTDRLAEEKERGITIELGFAPLELEAAGQRLRCGVVDVPGHERFVKNMVAGASGIDLVLLVVAADEAVMPQTREHLDICRLLDVRTAVVALTKIDVVDPEMADLATEDVRDTLRDTVLADAPVVPCSSVTGAGLDTLRDALARLALEVSPRQAQGPARLPVDRVFTMKGHGTVITGTLAGGTVRVGDALEVLPGNEVARVRSIQTHGRQQDEARAGTRTALNLQGIDRVQVARGNLLATPGALSLSRSVDVALQVVQQGTRPLKHRSRVLVHAGTTQVTATVSFFAEPHVPPGGSAAARLLLDPPGAALWGRERFILRTTGPFTAYGKTVGGGFVLDPDPPRRRRRDPGVLALLATLDEGSLDARLLALVDEAGHAGVRRQALLRRTGAAPGDLDKALDRLGSGGRLLRFDKEADAWASAAAVTALHEAAEQELRAFHQKLPMRAGMPRAELHTRLGGDALPQRLFHAALMRMSGIDQEADVIRLSEHRASANATEVVDRLRSVLQEGGMTPPRPKDIPDLLDDLTPEDVDEGLAFLVQNGEAVKVRGGLVFDAGAVDDLRQRLVAHLEEHGQVSAQEFKAIVGASRKFVIPLAEHFDAERLTMRVGEKRVLRGR